MIIVDLSYPLQTKMFHYPSDPDIKIETKKPRTEEVEKEILDEGGFGSGAGFSSTKYFSGQTKLSTTTHHGTHIDAPLHKIPEGKTIHQLPISNFVNPVELLDLRPRRIVEREKALITLEDLEFSGALNLKTDTKALLLYTGFCDYLKNKERYSLEKRRAMQEKFPAMQESAAIALTQRYKTLNVLGMDSFSFDPRGSNSESHRIIIGNNTHPLETLWNLGELYESMKTNPTYTKTLHCVPLSIKEGDAAPTRAYVILNK